MSYSNCNQTWGQILWKVFKYITITLAYQWLQLQDLYKCNDYNYNYFRIVIKDITNYFWSFYVKLLCYIVLTFKIIKTDRVFEVIYKAMSYTVIS